MRRRRDVGDLGEDELRRWAAQRGIVASKSYRDKHGWDFLLEFPPILDSGDLNPFETAPPPVRCIVQVKSTDNSDRKIRVKLSNAIHFVQWPLPCFFLLLQYSGKETPQSAYLVHFWDEHICRVLKRKLDLDLQNVGVYNRRTFSITCNDSDALESLDGLGLEGAIARNMDAEYENYGRRKLEIIESVGFENGRSLMNFEVSGESVGEDADRFLVDLALGFKGPVEVKNFRILDQRFGIVSEVPSTFYESGQLSVLRGEPFSEGTMLLRASGDLNQVRVPVEIFLPKGVGRVVRKSSLRARLDGPFLSISFPIGRPGSLHVNLSDIDPEKEYDLQDLNTRGEVHRIVYEASKAGKEIEIVLETPSSDSISGRLAGWDGSDHGYTKIWQVINWAWSIARNFDLQREVKVKLVDLVPQANKLQFLSYLIGSNKRSVRVCFDAHVEVGEVCVPIAFDALLGEHRIMVVFSIWGQLKPEPVSLETERRSWSVTSADIRQEKLCICDRKKKPALTLSGLVKSVVDNFDESVTCIVPEEYSR